MPSLALMDWRGKRQVRLDELLAAHKKIDPKPGPGRRVGTEQLNLALMVALAGEWQGFARDLHNEAVDLFVDDVEQAGSPVGAARLRQLMTLKRRLDSGNADESALSDDFGRLGIITLSQELDQFHARTKGRREKLRLLMTARNGFAHGDRRRLDELRAAGVALNLATVASWRSALDGLATTLDAYVASYLAALFGRERPW